MWEFTWELLGHGKGQLVNGPGSSTSHKEYVASQIQRPIGTVTLHHTGCEIPVFVMCQQQW